MKFTGKFAFEGDEVKLEREADKKGETEIRWKGLTDKNSDKLY